ncbi:HalOD1 output domain-containing protein [Halosolutus halophilus]|uniref:HalOD1 output domain-containing protein n=1 Tax=Halosolutus halophilus TaxID=1552990 RepID=UPI002235186B|nr:HalOD1 output domain-containing protein [Halosolutus halophilus]
MEESHTYSGSVQSRYDWSKIAPSIAVIDTIASIADTESTTLSAKLDGTLYDYVDPEALDTLVTDREAIAISFTIDEYKVQIDGKRIEIFYN